VGYYVYRHTEPFSVPDPAWRANGGEMVPQPASGTNVVFYDEFYPLIGQTYYYRLTVVDIYDEESDPSNQLAITISAQDVTGLDPTSGFYGDTVTIFGLRFGIHDPEVDRVLFATDGGERLAAEIVSWNDPVIECLVPTGAVTGPVQVEIAGTVAETDEDFTILNPFLYSVSPAYAAYGQQITLAGDNLTDSPSAGDGVIMPDGYLMPAESPDILSWSDEEIILTVPAIFTDEGDIRVQVGGEETNGVFFSLKPFIQAVTPRRLVPGSPTQVSISGLNFGDGTDGTVYLVDLTEEDPVEPVAVPPGLITQWTPYEVVFLVPEAQYGQLPAVRVVRAGFWSEPYSVAMLEGLSVQFLQPAQNYSVEEPTLVLVKPAVDMERVEFFINTLTTPVHTDSEGPEYSLLLDPQEYRNGTYYLMAKAYRGSEVALGTLTFHVLSLRGDTNGDGVVDDGDIERLRNFFGVLSPEPSYRRYLDPNLDGRINEQDVSYIGYFYTGSFGGNGES